MGTLPIHSGGGEFAKAPVPVVGSLPINSGDGEANVSLTVVGTLVGPKWGEAYVDLCEPSVEGG